MLGRAERSIRPLIELVFALWTRMFETDRAALWHATRWRRSWHRTSAFARSPQRSIARPEPSFTGSRSSSCARQRSHVDGGQRGKPRGSALFTARRPSSGARTGQHHARAAVRSRSRGGAARRSERWSRSSVVPARGAGTPGPSRRCTFTTWIRRRSGSRLAGHVLVYGVPARRGCEMHPPVRELSCGRGGEAPGVGFEPTTTRLTVECSAVELPRIVASPDAERRRPGRA